MDANKPDPLTGSAVQSPPRRRALGAGSVAVVVCLAATLWVFGNLVAESKALSYLSSEPETCINCHVMNAQYNTWRHSSHAAYATCVDCHLPHGDLVAKMISKSRDGWKHSVAFTLDSFEPAIRISEDGARRVQDNCIECHSRTTAAIGRNASHYDVHDDPYVKTGRLCWDCHRSVPHGKVRAITTTPLYLGHQENR